MLFGMSPELVTLLVNLLVMVAFFVRQQTQLEELRRRMGVVEGKLDDFRIRLGLLEQRMADLMEDLRRGHYKVVV